MEYIGVIWKDTTFYKLLIGIKIKMTELFV